MQLLICANSMIPARRLEKVLCGTVTSRVAMIARRDGGDRLNPSKHCRKASQDRSSATGSVGGWFWQVDGVVYREIKGPSPIVSLALAHRLGDPSTLVQHFVAHARARQL